MKFSPPLGKVAIGCAMVGLVALAVWMAVSVVQAGSLSLSEALLEWRMIGVASAAYVVASLALVWRAYVIGSEKRSR